MLTCTCYFSGFFKVSYTGTFTFPSLETIGLPPSQTPSQTPSFVPTSTYVPTQHSYTPSQMPTDRPSFPPQQTVPTSQPSLSPPDNLTVSSSCGAPVTLSFDAYLRGAETVCVNFFANDTLQNINITMEYGGNDDEVAGYMTIVVYHSTNLFGLQVGGEEYYIPTVTYIGPWPSSWQNNTAGTYTANVDVSKGGLGGGDGYYYACILNGWFYGELEHYKGEVELLNLKTQCGSMTAAPSFAPSPWNELHSDENDDGEASAEAMIILASVLVPSLLILTAAIAYFLWRKRYWVFLLNFF